MVDRFPYSYGTYGSDAYGFSPYVYLESASSFAVGSSAAASRTLQPKSTSSFSFGSFAVLEYINQRSVFSTTGFSFGSPAANTYVVHQADPNSQELHLGYQSFNYAGPYWDEVEVELIPWQTLRPRTLVS